MVNPAKRLPKQMVGKRGIMDGPRKRAIKKPMDSESLYRQVFDMAMGGICIIDEKGIYIDTNEAYCHMLGFSYDEIVGIHAEEFIIPEERYKLKEEYIPTILKMGRVRLDSVIVRKDGSPVPVEVSGVRFSTATLFLAFSGFS